MTQRPDRQGTLLITGGVLLGRRVTVEIGAGRITAIRPSPTTRPSPATPGAADRSTVVDVGGATLLPGLHDHHVHLRAWAAATGSVAAGPPEVIDAAGLAEALRAAPSSEGGWIRAIGYHQSVAGDLDRWMLDRMVGDRPVRVQHRGGALWILNSAALAAIGLGDDPDAAAGRPGAAAGQPEGVEHDGAGRVTGRLWRADGWLGTRVPRPIGDGDRLLARIGQVAAARGVTGFTDATPDRSQADLDSLADACRRGILGQRLHLMAPLGARLAPGPESEDDPPPGPVYLAAGPGYPPPGPDHLAPGPGSPPPGPDHLAAGTDHREPGTDRRDPGTEGWVTLGPVKLILDDDRLPTITGLAATVGAAHRAGRPVAVHCVTQVQAVVAIAAFEAAGPVPGDRLEHAAVLDAGQIPSLRALGLTVVTQPGMVATRGDRYLLDVDRDDLPGLWRLRSLLDGGVAVAAGSDAPFGPDDPWLAVRTAVNRRTAGGAVLGAGERVGAAAALRLWSGRAELPAVTRRLAVGGPADLCAVAPGPEGVGARTPRVVLTVAGGRVLHHVDDRPREPAAGAGAPSWRAGLRRDHR